MTTALNEKVVLEPNGLLKACSWCLSRERLDELNRDYVVSHALCTACTARLVAQQHT